MNHKYFITVYLLLAAIAFYACQKEMKEKDKPVYDIILIAGQSNTLSGDGLTPSIDQVVTGIKQLGRFNSDNYKIIEALEPLQNHTPKDSSIGFALTFAKEYIKTRLQTGRQLLLIPCGADGSGFLNNRWNKGNDCYNDAVERVNKILDSYPGSKLTVVLWHQGESDVTFGAGYYSALDNMIGSMRASFHQKEADKIPFITGGFVPYWVDVNPKYGIIDSVLRSTPGRVSLTGYADPRLPFTITKPDNKENAIHFNANGQRELGKRYFVAYEKTVK